MKNIYTLTTLFALIFVALVANARPLTPEEAAIRLQNSQTARKVKGLRGALTLEHTVRDSQNRAAVYVFGLPSEGGFVVASADDEAFPLLGYAEGEAFDSSDIAPQFSWWLREYARQISFLRDTRHKEASTDVSAAPEGLEPIAPMVQSKWNQGVPYNKYCFEISADGTQTQSVTGCVATAMAQIMYYYKSPAEGHGEISYRHGDSGTYEMNFGEQPFDWNAMLPTYSSGNYTAEEGDAVAYLMKACGYSVKMDYSKGDAGANGANIATALVDYFGYDPNIEVQTRAFYTYDEWVKMIYDNLKNVGPLVYDGSALDGGHSFVCDGYDGNGYFHINWGWGGMSDGYYLLDALNPDEFGIGGAAGGYNLGQQVIMNISPDKAMDITPVLMQFGTAEGKLTDSRLSISLKDTDTPGLQYINPAPITLTLGLEMVNDSDPTQIPRYFESSKKNLEAKQGSYFSWEEYGCDVDLSDAEMVEGDTYRFIVSTYINAGGTSAWEPAVSMPGKYNYVAVKKTATGYELVETTPGNIEVADFKIVSDPIYWNKPVEFNAEFTNDTDTQLTRNYSAVFFNSEGKECYKMENYSVTVDANSTQEVEWTSIDWYKEDGAPDVTQATEFTVKLYDNWQGAYVEGIEITAMVEPQTGEVKVESELSILNGTRDGNIYVIKGDEIEVAITVKVTEGIFNHTLMFALQAPDKDGDYATVMHKHFDAIPNLSAGEEATYTMSVQIDEPDPDTTYRVEVWGPDNGFNEKAYVRFQPVETGVAEIMPDTDGMYRVVTLDGTVVGTYDSLEILHSLPGGIYIVNNYKLLLP